MIVVNDSFVGWIFLKKLWHSIYNDNELLENLWSLDKHLDLKLAVHVMSPVLDGNIQEEFMFCL